MNALRTSSIVLGLAVLISARALAQGELTRLHAFDSGDFSRLGCSAAVDGDTAVIGAYGHVLPDDFGAAHVFRQDPNDPSAGWIRQAKLLGSDSVYGDFFGWDVAVSGDIAVIGAPYDDNDGDPITTDVGSAYVFQRQGVRWIEQAKLLASDGAQADGFGYSVAISGDTAVIGAVGDDDDADPNGLYHGSAYVFTCDPNGVWAQQAKLQPTGDPNVAWFGYSVAISGDSVVIGAPQYDRSEPNDPATARGAAYVYEKPVGGWQDATTETSKLTPGEYGDRVGDSVAIDGVTVVIGAPGDDDDADPNNVDTGSAYVFKRSETEGWQQEGPKLWAGDGEANEAFGGSATISGDIAVIGMPLDDDDIDPNKVDSGSAYVFQRSEGEWAQVGKLLLDDGHAGDCFGLAAAVSGDAVVIGAPYHSLPNSTGLAYVFRGSDPNDPNWPQEAELSPAAGTAGDGLGYSVGISGLAAIVGAPYHQANGPDSGWVNMFRGDPNDPTDWHQRFDRLPFDGAAYDEHGHSVAIDADIAVIGSPGDDENGFDSGSAHVFRWSDTAGWQRKGAKLLAADGEPGDAFGFAVAVAGDRAVIGAPYDDDSGLDAGAAYVFRCDDPNDPNATWSQEAKLTLSPTESDPNDLLGYSVAIRGDVAIVGAPGDDYWGTDAGAAYVFHPDPNDPNGAWVREDPLLAIGGAANDRFGSSMAIDGNRIVVGAPYDDGTWTDVGAVYVFHQAPNDPYGPWFAEVKLTLTPDKGDPNDLLGCCVDIDGENVIVGAFGDDDDGTDAGAAYVFSPDPNDPDGWSPYAKLSSPDGAAGDWFGYSVALSGDIAVIGAPQDDYGDPNDSNYDSGTAYVFSLTCPDRNGDGYCDEGDCPGDVDGDWDVDLSDLAQLLSNYGTTSGATYEDGDLDGDGDVDLSDLAALLSVYGTTCT